MFIPNQFTCNQLASLIVREFEGGRMTWNALDIPTRRMFADRCDKLIGLFELKERSLEMDFVTGSEEAVTSIRNGEDMLYVGGVDPDDEVVVEAIAGELMREANVLCLHLWIYTISPYDTHALSVMLCENRSLLLLTLFQTYVDVEILSEGLAQNSTLLYLGLEDCSFAADDCRKVENLLRVNSTLLYLTMGGNDLGIEGTQHLSEGLRDNSTLMYLSIRLCRIGDEGVRYLSNMLRQNTTLLFVDIRENIFGPEGVQYLTDMLQENSTLLYLDIAGYGINDRFSEEEIQSMLELRERWNRSSRFEYSTEDCRLFLRYQFGIPSWTVCRSEVLPSFSEQLPAYLWGDILSFVSNDRPTLEESFLVPDIRSGFSFPTPDLSLFSANAPLLTMIPLIEGHFRCDTWTEGRLSLMGLSYSDFDDLCP